MKRAGGIFGILFGLMFLCIPGVIAMETLVPNVLDWQRMQGWQATTAELLDMQGVENKTEARYRYHYNGQAYTATRVYVASFNDNIGSYHKDLQQRLSKHLHNRQPLQIWVNPDNPAEAVIDRNMRWGMLAFMLVFLGIFFVIGVLALTGGMRQLLTPQVQLESAAVTEQDVQQHKAWRANRIHSDTPNMLWLFWIFGMFWNAMSMLVIFTLPEEVSKGNYVILLGLLFPLVGLFLLGKALQYTLEFWRFGKTELVMDPFPGAIGGQVGGAIELARFQPHGVDLKQAFTVTLECVYSYKSGSGKDRSREERIKWAEQGKAHAEATTGGLRLQFCFDVPKGLPESSVNQRDDYHFWNLRVQGEMPGVDLDRSFRIPVLRSASGRHSSIRHNLSDIAREQRAEASLQQKQAILQGDFHLTKLKRSVRIQQRGDELLLRFPMFRNKGLTLFAAIFAGSFGFATYSIVSEFFSVSLVGVLGFLFAIPFMLVALVAGIAAIYLPFNNLRVVVDSRGVQVLRRLLVIPFA